MSSCLLQVSGHSYETELAREARINAFKLQLAHLQLAKLSCPSGFNLCKGLSDVLLINGIVYVKQEISLDVIFGSILEIGQICHYLFMSLNLLHDILLLSSQGKFEL